MNNENKNFFNNYETSANEEEIVLAPPTELLIKAEYIAQSTKSDPKFPFMLIYDANQKEYLLSMLQTIEGVVKGDDEESHMLSTLLNMTQLAFIKRLDCVQRVKSDEVTNPFLAEETTDAEPLATASLEADASAPLMTLSMDETTQNDGIAYICDSSTSDDTSCSGDSSCSCPTNSSMETALEINVETLTNGNICCPGAEQWFKFTVPESKSYTIHTLGNLDTVGTLYDSCGCFIIEVDDQPDCGKVNFRINHPLTANSTYYIRVRESKQNTGTYSLIITEKTLVNYISVTPNEITLDHIGKVYELPSYPNTFLHINGVEPVPSLAASINPSWANEQRMIWISSNNNIIRIDKSWHNGQLYQTMTIVGFGTVKLYAYDRRGHGMPGECTIYAGAGWPVYSKPLMHSRDEWEAVAPITDRLRTRERAPERIIFHHPAKSFSSTNVSDIKEEIKRIQNVHISAWDGDPKSDIAYHFIIDPSGGIWQCAEIDEYKRGHAEGHFDDIGVSVLGNFEPEFENFWSPNTLNDHQKSAMQELSKWLCYEYDLKPNTTDTISPITTHRTVDSGTVCPGANAAPWIESDLKNYISGLYCS